MRVVKTLIEGIIYAPFVISYMFANNSSKLLINEDLIAIEEYYSKNIKFNLGTKGLSINDKKTFLNQLTDDKFVRKPLLTKFKHK